MTRNDNNPLLGALAKAVARELANQVVQDIKIAGKKALDEPKIQRLQAAATELIHDTSDQVRAQFCAVQDHVEEVVQGLRNHGSFIDAESTQYAGDADNPQYAVIHDRMSLFQRQTASGASTPCDRSGTPETEFARYDIPAAIETVRVPFIKRERHPLDYSDLYLLRPPVV